MQHADPVACLVFAKRLISYEGFFNMGKLREQLCKLLEILISTTVV